jgi:hypothetical protein
MNCEASLRITIRCCSLRISKNGHSRVHATKAKLGIERLPARDGVQDDFAMTSGKVNQSLYELLSQAGSLIGRVDHNVAEIRTIHTVGNGASSGNNFSAIKREALEHAVRIGSLQPIAALGTQRSDAIELGHLIPIDRIYGLRPMNFHDDPY